MDDNGLQPSLLDRLLDDESDVSSEPPYSRGRTLRELKAAVKRDIEFLLNARCNFVEVPEDKKEARQSVLFYGLPDFTTWSMSQGGGQGLLARAVERAVKIFEPRMTQIRVSLVPRDQKYDRTVHFRIEGLLRTDPTPEPITFDSVLEMVSGQLTVRGDD